jgi:U6 snRNA phosphodiesterase
MVRTEHRTAFIQKLEEAVERSGVKPFRVHVTGLDWVPNSEKTRWFLVLRLGRPGNDGLNLLLAAMNCVARDSGLEMLYGTQEATEDGASDKELRIDKLPAGRTRLIDVKHRRLASMVQADCTSKFHLSIAWQLEEPGQENLESVGALKSVESFSISCNCVKVKIGNAIHDVALGERRLSEQGSGGM